MIHVAYAINEAYTDYCLASIVSLLVNNRNEIIKFHILIDNLSSEAKAKFCDVIGTYSWGGGIEL